MKTSHAIKLTALTVAMAFSTVAISATDGDNDIITGWQSSLATQFIKLDTSGNGLLMPLEASKNKAFSKKTFAAADTDGDGSIDQDEYIHYRTSMGAKDVSATMTNESNDANTSSSNDISVNSTNSAKAIVDEPVPTTQTAEMSQDNADSKKSSVGDVIDDSVITTKSKAAIFNTPDLKTLQISIETHKGEVLLSGFVDNEAAKMKAEEVVKNVGGVKSVKNSLEVKG